MRKFPEPVGEPGYGAAEVAEPAMFPGKRFLGVESFAFAERRRTRWV